MNTLWKNLLIFFSLLAPQYVLSFQAPGPIATINGSPIQSGEFLYAFSKNYQQQEALNVDTLFQYLDQYINFKLKVLAAVKLGIDTTDAFKKEYEGYISQLKRPYEETPIPQERLIEEAYERLQWEINASHILIMVKNPAIPPDTLKAYEKISTIREELIAGASFEELAKRHSQDGSARSGGQLGYFTGFTMVYPFESAAYQTPVGEISPIVRTRFGYHLIKVNDKRKTKGKVKTSHIMLSKNNHPKEEGVKLINQVYDSLKNGGDWNVLCRQYSEHGQTKNQGGSLPLLGTGQLPESYLEAAVGIKDVGGYAAPVETDFGWHIIKLDEEKRTQTLEEMRQGIVATIQRQGRGKPDKNVLINRLKGENGFDLNTGLLNEVIGKLSEKGMEVFNDSFKIDETLFQIGTRQVPTKEFYEYLKADQAFADKKSGPDYLWPAFEKFQADQIIAYEESILSDKYPEYNYLLKEYYEGLLLFEIMEKEVWSKAVADTEGLERFFLNNQPNYPAPERAVVLTIRSDSLEVLTSLETSIEDLKDVPNPKKAIEDILPKETFQSLKIVKRTVEKSDFSTFALKKWEPGVSLKNQEGQKSLDWLVKILPAGFYQLEEIKGLVISDYQDFLEKAWVSDLRKGNKIKINKKQIKGISKSAKQAY